MINELIQYSAVTVKARAMYGKMLSDEDWSELMSSEDLHDVWEILHRSDGWKIPGEEPRCATDEAVFTDALNRQLEKDCQNLCLYLKKKDKETLSFFLKRPDGSMTPEEARQWWREGGAKNAGLRRIAGAEADALNLVYILRLRRFPGSISNSEAYLIPVRDKLSEELVQRLLRAQEDKDALEVLKGTPWEGAFRSLAPGDLERQYSLYMAAFCRRVLITSTPGLTSAQAFLTLKDMERQRLTRLVQAAARGIDPDLVV